MCHEFTVIFVQHVKSLKLPSAKESSPFQEI